MASTATATATTTATATATVHVPILSSTPVENTEGTFHLVPAASSESDLPTLPKRIDKRHPELEYPRLLSLLSNGAVCEVQRRVRWRDSKVLGPFNGNRAFAPSTREQEPPSYWWTLSKRRNPVTKLRNDLLPAIGFIELANVGDFPANVWNEAPLPKLAIILMGFGGTLALSMIPFVVWDAIRSARNVRSLQTERRHLRQQRQAAVHHGNSDRLRAVDSLRRVNLREQGTEWVDRLGMDMLMGFVALVVGVGTYMAIAGENPRVHLASDLLTGYVGNSPCALYCLINLSWSMWLWWRATKHVGAPESLSDDRIEKLLRLRANEFRLHSLLSGLNGLAAGVSSMLTYTYWQAYTVLAVCLVMSVLLNYLWRNRLGYDRPLLRQGQSVDFDLADIEEALKYTMDWQSKTEAGLIVPLQPLLCSVSDIMLFLGRHGLFDMFCLTLCRDFKAGPRLWDDYFTMDLRIDAEDVVTLACEDTKISKRIRSIAEDVIRASIPKCFEYQQRWLLEILGCYRSLPRENICKPDRGYNDEFALDVEMGAKSVD